VEREALDAVVVAAGASRRMGFDKLFTPRNGQTLFEVCLRRLRAFPELRQLVVVTSSTRLTEVKKTLQRLGIAEQVQVVLGGVRRQDSVAAGLGALSSKASFVMVHDAARPLITNDLIRRVWEEARLCGAAACATPSRDTVKEVDPQGGWVKQTLDRSRVWMTQTPQIFRRDLLEEAYRALWEDGGKDEVTDDAAALERIGRPVRLVPYEGWNFKVTFPSDWELVWMLLEKETLSCSPGSRRN
jgi:2-C-methyl-D-erythritol 4-phosphate cytidylyltransferase